MKILYQSRFNLFSRSGGDTIQIVKTKEYIEKLFPYIKIDINSDPNVNLDDYDLVHVFNLLRPQEVYLFVSNAKRQNKKVVLSTIYWKSEEFEKKGQQGIRKIINSFLNFENIERLRALYRYYLDGEKHRGTMKIIQEGFHHVQKDILENVDYLLPNGEGEIDLITKEFSIKSLPFYSVVPNAIDSKIFGVDPSVQQERNVILCVGRIEPRKNQLNLVKAVKGMPYKLVIVGKAHETQKGYYKKIKNYIKQSENIEIIEAMNQEQLSHLYRKAKVHVLPSWYDTPGLVSLEAAVNGCNVVITDRGTTREYFSNYAFYCEPGNIDSIRNAISKAYRSEVNPGLMNEIATKFTWEQTAIKTVDCYKKIIQC